MLVSGFMEISSGMTTLYLTKKHAKQCAIIAVDEIINALHDSDEIDTELVLFWLKVKSELERL